MCRTRHLRSQLALSTLLNVLSESENSVKQGRDRVETPQARRRLAMATTEVISHVHNTVAPGLALDFDNPAGPPWMEAETEREDGPGAVTLGARGFLDRAGPRDA